MNGRNFLNISPLKKSIFRKFAKFLNLVSRGSRQVATLRFRLRIIPILGVGLRMESPMTSTRIQTAQSASVRDVSSRDNNSDAREEEGGRKHDFPDARIGLPLACPPDREPLRELNAPHRPTTPHPSPFHRQNPPAPIPYPLRLKENGLPARTL